MLLSNEPALADMRASTRSTKQGRMAMACFLQLLWLPVETIKIKFINYVDSEMFLSVSFYLFITHSPIFHLVPFFLQYSSLPRTADLGFTEVGALAEDY